MEPPSGSTTRSTLEPQYGSTIELEEARKSPQINQRRRAASSVSSSSIQEGPGVVRDNLHEDQRPRRPTVDRALKGYHVFFISVSGILGIGLYVRSGNMLRVGGPGAVLIPFLILGLLAWMVMQCISEMLLIWPVSGALRLFVQKFVDQELGYAVGVAYWLAYSMTFAALISATAGEANIWRNVSQYSAVRVTVFFALCSSALLIFNLFKVRKYGILEIVGGSLKIVFIFVVMSMMIAINAGVSSKCGQLAFKTYHKNFFRHDAKQTAGWAGAFFIALQVGAFAFIGIEIPAVLAVEADIMYPSDPEEQQPQGLATSRPAKLVKKLVDKISSDSRKPANRILKFSAVYLPVWTAVIYLLAGFLVTLNVGADDFSLPSNAWESDTRTCNPPEIGPTLCGNVQCTTSNSGFVISAHNAQLSSLPDVITVFLILTALSSANTALYVASRTLYDLGRLVEVPESRGLGSWPRRIFSQFGSVGNRRVPRYALCASWIMFVWIPFLSLKASTSIAELLYILGEMAAEFCIIVWACECYAFIRFYKYIHLDENKAWIRLKSNESNDQGMQYLRRDLESYPYMSHAQPALAWIALFLCMMILIVASGATLWKGNQSSNAIWTEAVAAYLAPLCFVALFLSLKLNAYGLNFRMWFSQNLQADFQLAVQELNDEREQSRMY